LFQIFSGSSTGGLPSRRIGRPEAFAPIAKSMTR